MNLKNLTKLLKKITLENKWIEVEVFPEIGGKFGVPLTKVMATNSFIKTK